MLSGASPHRRPLSVAAAAAAFTALACAGLASAGASAGASPLVPPVPPLGSGLALPTVQLGDLPPVRVPADGRITVPVRNLSVFGVTIEATATLGSLTDAATATSSVPALASQDVTLVLGDEALRRLQAASWLTATVRLAVLGIVDNGAGGISLSRDIRLIAPSSTPRLASNPTNPLAGVPWASYDGPLEPVSAPYDAASVALQNRLASVALTPKARWFTPQVPPARLGQSVGDYIRTAQQETPGGLVQLTMFVLTPWEDDAVHRLPTPAEIVRDKAYIDAFVTAIGSARTLVVVQPDGPFAGEEPHHASTLARLVALAVHRLASLPDTAAYIDMGSADWHRGDTSRELPLLLQEGIDEARGFAMDITHADSTANQIDHAHQLIVQLARHGVDDVHAVIDTSDNGRPFGGSDWQARYHDHGPSISTAPACHRASQRLCLVAGIPPTTDVADPRWGLTAHQRTLAATEVDGYIWAKRPWLDPFHGYAFVTQRALDVMRLSPYR